MIRVQFVPSADRVIEMPRNRCTETIPSADSVTFVASPSHKVIVVLSVI